MTYQITEADVEAFTTGDCWALAREISNLTGWRMVAFGAYADDKIDSPQRTLRDFDWVHVLVETPEGKYLDVTGISDAQTITDSYAHHIYGTYGWDADYCDFEPVLREQDWEDMRMDRCRVFPEADEAAVASALIWAYERDEFSLLAA